MKPWNDAIKDAMQKSSLVTLAVTPNVTEPDPEHTFLIGLAYLGEMREALGQFKEAREAYERMQKYAEERYNQMPEAVETRRCLAASFERMGDLSKEEGNTTAAGEYYEKAFEISKQLVDESSTTEHRRGLYSCYINWGSLHTDDGNLDAAKNIFWQRLISLHNSLLRLSRPIHIMR